jgi:hypothetical protein
MAANKEAPQYLFTDRKAGADGREPVNTPTTPFPPPNGSHPRADWPRYEVSKC